jgi:ferritin-like protein
MTDSNKTDEQAKVQIDPMMQFFEFGHLPPHLQAISSWFFDAACKVQTLPRNAERTVALRKLLEAKDCAVRAALAKP